MSSEELLIGIDEAGRGPLFGDMVIALVCCSREAVDRLKSYGVVDSKELSPEQRAVLARAVIACSRLVVTTRVSPLEIDTFNLNRLTLDKILYLLSSIRCFISVDHVRAIYVDMVRGYERVIGGIEKLYPRASIVFEERADSKYTVVAAASIIAKHYRDMLIKELKRVYGEIGSGYPVDKKTIDWIIESYSRGSKPPPFLRRTWSILERIAPKWYREKRVRDTSQKSILDYIMGR